MVYICRPTHKLASHWLPQQKPKGIFALGFALFFIMRIFAIEHSFNFEAYTTGRSKKLNVGYEQTTSPPLSFRRVFIEIHFP